MLEEVLQLMEEKKKEKKNNIKYRKLPKNVQSKIRVTKKKWWSGQCTEIETWEKIQHFFTKVVGYIFKNDNAK